MRELYQQLIIDHGRHPRNFGKMADANLAKEGYNPLCGDQLTLYIKENNGVIDDVKFDGCGCAISTASASLLTEALKGKSFDAVQILFKNFHTLVTTGELEHAEEKLGKLVVLAGVAEFPARVKCATLAWHTAMAAIDGNEK